MMNLIISLVAPWLVGQLGAANVGWIFIVCGGLTLLGTLFIVVYMKETAGKTKLEIEALFYTETNNEFK